MMHRTIHSTGPLRRYTLSVLQRNFLLSQRHAAARASLVAATHPRSYKSTLSAAAPDVAVVADAHSPTLSSSRTSVTPPTLPVAAYDQSIRRNGFPSLIIGANQSLQPVGSFAQAQAMFLQPDLESVQQVANLLQQTNTGIVAHYYMDVELQGVLQAVSKLVPGRVGIADSLKMGDMAVDMASNANQLHPTGIDQVICLGVDFMAESVQAILQHNRYAHIPVYRAAQAKIGCSLAESAERDVYRAWLQQESSKSNSTQSSNPSNPLHVVYINTSLETKAVSSSIVPTITCTSSNVLATLLQASVQIPHLKLLYGPDTYMGDNLITLLNTLIETWDDDRVASSLHPQHTIHSLKQLRDSIVVFPSGNCVVHHMFGQAVVDAVKRDYQDQNDVYVTAHLEVPGEMFEIAMAKSLTDDGVVGSTSDILRFITRKVQQAATSDDETDASPRRLKFILGTEAGMVTSIVQNVQHILDEQPNASRVQAEIIFPVSSEAVMSTDEDATHDTGLSVVPGAGGGEGCSTAGGCATCPFMKMNDLDALISVLELMRDHPREQSPPQSPTLLGHLPPDRLRGKSIDGVPAVELGTQSIQYMRHFMKHQQLPDELVQKVLQR